MPKAKTSKTYI
jgi:hypothetical protein